MIIEARIDISGSKAAVWELITDIEHAAETITGIDRVEILERPARGLVGLKWRETRTLFGKTATEVMWITAAVEQTSYETRAESHGCVYTCAFRLEGRDGALSLTMSHETRPQALLAKLLAAPMGLAFKGTLRKALLKDLQDVKARVEASPRAPAA
jgi:hypothetical protein